MHHLTPQKHADSEGFIEDEFHKNHVANLAAVCEKCHKKMHTLPDMKRRKTTNGYHLLPVSK